MEKYSEKPLWFKEIENIDWEKPWFSPYKPYGYAVYEYLKSQTIDYKEQLPNLCQSLNVVTKKIFEHRQQAAPIKFVSQNSVSIGRAYEEFIFQTKQCPTRDGLHDFFNALVWMRFPRIKTCLNTLQMAQIQAQGVGAHRGAVRDAITIFDENSILWFSNETLLTHLYQHHWQAVFVHHRSALRQTPMAIFGHALLEKLTQPRKNITAHVVGFLAQDLQNFANENPLEFPAIERIYNNKYAQGIDKINDFSYKIAPNIPQSTFDDFLDAFVVQRMSAAFLQTKPFTPLPVMGLPTWDKDNESTQFYDDPSVFRPKRVLA